MRFRCPRCQTGYELPLESLPVPGDEKTPYRLKCVRCKCIFIMTVEMASPGEFTASESDVYYELISPSSVVDVASDHEQRGDVTQRFRFEFKEAHEHNGTGSLGPTVSNADSWEKDNTLELSDYAIGSFHRAAIRKLWIAGGISCLIIGFVLYVAAMNRWSISINRLDGDIKRAFFLMTPAEVEADLLQQMSVSLGRGYTLKVRQGRTVGIIRGEIQNNTPVAVSNVMLEGRILDTGGQVVKTLLVPCGVKIQDNRLRKMRHDRIPLLYRRKGQPANCTIKSGYSEYFKVVFHDLPKYFNSAYVFEVHPYAARILP